MKTALLVLCALVVGTFTHHASYRQGYHAGRLNVACQLFVAEPPESRAKYPALSKDCAKFAPTPETYGER